MSVSNKILPTQQIGIRPGTFTRFLEKTMDVKYPSLEEILSRYPFHQGILNQECPNDTRIEIARKLDDWKLMGRQGFRFEPCEVSSIDEDSKKSVEMKKIALMDAWARKYGKDASYLNLAQALYSIGRRDLVDHLCKLILKRINTDKPSSDGGEYAQTHDDIIIALNFCAHTSA